MMGASTGELQLRATRTEKVEQVLREREKDQMTREVSHVVPPRCRQSIQLLFFDSPTVCCQGAAHMGFIWTRCLQKLRKALEERGF